MCRSATEMSSTVIAAFATLWQFVNEPLGFMLPGKCGSELTSVSCVLQRCKLVYIYIFLKLAGPLVKLDEDSGAVYEMSTEKSQQYFNNWFIFSSFFGLNAKYLVPVFNINICYLCSLFMNLVLLCWFQSHSQQIHIMYSQNMALALDNNDHISIKTWFQLFLNKTLPHLIRDI